MEKRKPWQKWLIVGALLLTVYNVLPTLFFYSKPLKAEIDQPRSEQVASRIMHRVNHLERKSVDWLESYCKLLSVKPQSIVTDEAHPELVAITFKDHADANTFRNHLTRAGTLIPTPAEQLSLLNAEETLSKTVLVQRKIPLRFDTDHVNRYFQYSKKRDERGQPTPLYRALIFDRAMQLAVSLAGPSEPAQLVQSILNEPDSIARAPLVLKAASDLRSFAKVFGETSALSQSYFASYTQMELADKHRAIETLIEAMNQTKDQVKLERIQIQSEAQTLQASGGFLDTTGQQRLEQLQAQESLLSESQALLSKHKSTFAGGKTPLTFAALSELLEEGYTKAREGGSQVQNISIRGLNPFFSNLSIDWSKELFLIDRSAPYSHFEKRATEQGQEQAKQWLYNSIAFAARHSGEKITPYGDAFKIKLNQLESSTSFLALRLSEVAKGHSAELRHLLHTQWHPKHPDLKGANFPLWDYATYQSLPAHEQKLGMLIYAPAMENDLPKFGLKNNSIYLIAKGLDQIMRKSSGSDAQILQRDFQELSRILQSSGLFGYPGSQIPHTKEFANDYVFEGEDFFMPLLKATGESFNTHGTKRLAILEFTNVQQRILADNRIDTAAHEELLKWRDDYNSAQVGIGGATPYDVPKPTRSVFLDNFKLSCKKYIRGDERKVLHWGLDLSGGKTVQIELRDHNNQLVTGDQEINQGINELYARVNKMGVSEVTIRKEGNFITLDFPGSQELSASELIKASTMYFHIVNEKFNGENPQLANASQQFLQDVWNEAVITGKKSGEEINQIAWRHIHGDSLDPDAIQPRSEAARILHENGLVLSSPLDSSSNNLFNDSVSTIAVLRGDDYTEWHGKTHPLLIVFKNFAIDGASLKGVNAGYDQNKGNFLTFEIKGKETLPSGEKINPRDDLYSWTSQFSQDKVAGGPRALYSKNLGWRMAVILNGSVITAPTLNQPIRDGGTIEGNFTQREVNKLESDLKAGSLTFTPRILSEKNVSPELGAKERSFGIMATGVAILLVTLLMIGYYRFGGIVASAAVIINLLIMWAVLQNINATLTLASIAAAILTLGMAVDANVLVFERIREEFSKSGRLASSVHAGYRKAFSAILDSNVTTIIAALILLQFDSGPIKGFALTIIIGIASSMFTALFLTRFFFAGWVRNPKHTKLSMAHLIKATKFPFMKYGKIAMGASAAIILAGGFFFFQQKSTILGMDFTGGYSLNLEVEPQHNRDNRTAIESALTKAGAHPQEIQVRELSPSTSLRLFLSKSLQEEGRPFYQMPIENDGESFAFAFQKNPRILWVISALKAEGISLTVDSLASLDKNWTEVSGQLSDSMRNSALVGLALAVLCILVYITVRFEFKYAVSATLCLAHDIAITLASIAILYALGMPLQIDLNTIAALMTIVGYSLNDTIIVFDRIREDMRLMPDASFTEIINHALNVTLSRTTMTSTTTLFALLPLVLLGGSTLFAFSLIMIVGVVFGTLSSLFIAAPMLRYFHARQGERETTSPEVVQ